MINLKDVYWLAGILEGEGCFTVGSRKSLTFNHQIKIEMETTDRDIAEKVLDIMKCGNIHSYQPKNEKYKVKHKFTAYQNNAAAWMMIIYPLMGSRRKARIKEVLLLWKIEVGSMADLMETAKRFGLDTKFLEIMK